MVWACASEQRAPWQALQGGGGWRFSMFGTLHQDDERREKPLAAGDERTADAATALEQQLPTALLELAQPAAQRHVDLLSEEGDR